MRNIYILLVILVCTSCKKTEVLNPEQAEPGFKQTITAEKLVDLSVKAAGLEKLYNATLYFEKKETQYSAKRDGYTYEYVMKRTKKNIAYRAVASNGTFDYTENGEAVSYGSQNTLLEQKLIFDNNILAIPRIFQNDNSITLELIEQTEVKNIDYRVFQVHYNDQLPSDQMRNVRVYINPSSLLPDYICYSYGDNNRLLWTENTKRHDVDGVIIADSKTYIPLKRTDNHKEMVSYVNTGAIKQTEHVQYSNLKLIPN